MAPAPAAHQRTAMMNDALERLSKHNYAGSTTTDEAAAAAARKTALEQVLRRVRRFQDARQDRDL